MAKSPAEPINLVLKHLRVLRAEMNARFDKMDERFARIEADTAGIKREIRGFKLNTIAEVY